MKPSKHSKQWKNSARIVLWVTLAIAMVAALSPGVLLGALQIIDAPDLPIATALGPNDGDENWQVTSAALQRTQNQLCPPGFECKELCVQGVGTGDFQCWMMID